MTDDYLMGDDRDTGWGIAAAVLAIVLLAVGV